MSDLLEIVAVDENTQVDTIFASRTGALFTVTFPAALDITEGVTTTMFKILIPGYKLSFEAEERNRVKTTYFKANLEQVNPDRGPAWIGAVQTLTGFDVKIQPETGEAALIAEMQIIYSVKIEEL